MTPESLPPLIHRHLDGTATPEEGSRLALALLDDPAAASAFAQATRLEADLRACFQGEAVGRRLADTVRFETSQRGRPAGRGWAAAAAALVLVGLSLAWWWPWTRRAAAPALADITTVTPRRVTEAPPPPPSLRRLGGLSAAAREVKQLASRYWLPEAIDFAHIPLEEAVGTLQQRATAVNHRQNGTIAAFAIELPEECARHPINASRAELPLGAWLELLSAQAGCELRYTETGVAFDPVEQPDRLETRRFPLPTIADADAPTASPARLFSYARPWDEAADFRSAPAHGSLLATAWGIPLPASTRVVVKDGRSLDVRHTRRELRRIEGLLAVATADAGRPLVTFRAKEVPLPVLAREPAVAQAVVTATVDNYSVDLTLAPEVFEFEGFINYGAPIDAGAGIVLTESFIQQPVVATRTLGAGNQVVDNKQAGALLAQLPLGPLFRTPQLGRVESESATFSFLSSTEGVTRPSLTLAEQEVVLAQQAAEEQAEPDPWQRAVSTTVPLGESAWLATNAELVVMGRELMHLSFSLTDLQPPPSLNAVARLEGEMVKLTGSYTPPGGSGVPTDFQAYVGEGQSFILQTEDTPVAASEEAAMVKRGQSFLLQKEDTPEALASAAGGVVDSGLLFGTDSSLWGEAVNGRAHTGGGLFFGDQQVAFNGISGLRAPSGAASTWDWQDLTHGKPVTGGAAVPATVRGVVISPVLHWPSVVAQ